MNVVKKKWALLEETTNFGNSKTNRQEKFIVSSLTRLFALICQILKFTAI